ncbi:hypothetical protein RD792_017061 [Penstemon davidsonii]|uniref:Polygalacturonase n=1 Tax=Penstemon davidsonii TaxID=160366 RepID=A0ABR0CKZ6_9LAMI|nr:hypothetical protein RD792_017061 [Penstemon davidsonii]
MDLKLVLSLCVCLVFLLCTREVHGLGTIFKVTNFGAIPDGKTDNSKAFVGAWAKACSTRGGVVEVPLGTYKLSSATFQGPCNGETLFRIKGTIKASNGPSLDQEYWIEFRDIDGFTILGNGTFDGKGKSAWSYNNCHKSSNCDHPPVSIRIISVKNSVIRGINSKNSKWFHFHIALCDNVLVNNIDIIAPANSPNTDGIHISNSNNIRIRNTRISTGDDCISIGDGNTNINITRVLCGPGHGISIGSLGKYKNEEDVRGITVTNCSFTNTDNGLRIKTWAPSTVSTTVSDVTFANINMNNVKNPVIIDQYYCPHSSCSHQGESDITIKGVKFINVKGNSASKVGVDIQCSKSKPCKDILLSGMNLKYKGTGQPTTASCSNAGLIFVGPNQTPSRCF